MNVQEPFVTPRMLACGLVLLGLDWQLRGRPVLSGATILLAAALHPLMAFGGLLVWAGFHLWKHLGVKTFVGALVGTFVLMAIVLAVEPLGKRCFGAMDDVWRQSILYSSSFNFPSEWAWSDWAYLAFQLAILGAAIWRFHSIDADKARFLIVLLVVTLAAAVGAVLAEQSPYALLFQGQPYRAFWLLAFLHLALVFWLAIDCFQQTALVGQLAGCALLAYLCSVNGIVAEYVLPMLLFPIFGVALRGMDKEPRDPTWLVHSVQMSVVIGSLGWMAYKFVLLARGYDEMLLRYPDHREVLEMFLLNLGPTVFLVVLCWLLVRIPWHRPAWYGVAAVGCLGVQTLFFAFPETDVYQERCTRYRADLRVVHEIIARDRPASQPLATVYCNLGCLDYVWLNLHSNSYFDWWQTGNYMFRREMAVEGQRRARLVGPFEIARYRKIEHQLTPGYKDGVARLFQTDFSRGPINQDDVARLCREPGLDYLVLEQKVEGVPAVQAGRLYLYSCNDVRLAEHAACGQPCQGGAW
jgi:hypothetical protein